jgi:hypothetical protein
MATTLDPVMLEMAAEWSKKWFTEKRLTMLKKDKMDVSIAFDHGSNLLMTRAGEVGGKSGYCLEL